MVDHQRGYLSCGSPPGVARGPSPTLGLPSPGFWCWEEGLHKNLFVKINGDSSHPGKMESSWKSGHTFKEPVHSLNHLQALMVDSSGETAVQEMPEIYTEKLS